MHIFGTAIFALIAAYWVTMSVIAMRGMARVPRLSCAQPREHGNFPQISVIFAARDEAEKLPAALESFLALDYPNFEIVAVDDRSRDATPKILDQSAANNAKLTVIHVADLPPGWLGKPHALQCGFEKSAGEWLVFTDADVQFAPEILRRALALAEQGNADHLTLLAALDLRGFWEPVAVGYLGVCFALGVQPWRTSDSKSKAYMGVGAFQLIRRSAYEAAGGHRRLALEVLDDMKLGKIAKLSGARSMVALSEAFLSVRWQEGLGNVIRGLTKNMFAGFDFSVARALGGICGILVISVLPFAGVLFARGAAQIAAAVAMCVSMYFEVAMMPKARASRLFGLTHPLGALATSYIIARSMVLTLLRGGVEWRGTFYRLEELRRGQV